VQVLTHAFSRLLFDVTALRPAAGAAQAPIMLVGPGDLAEAAEPGGEEWLAPNDGQAVHDMRDHLILNNVGYTRRPATFFGRGWNGPYVDMLTTDPWGRRYCSNLGLADAGSSAVVLSAGPNGKVETPFRDGSGRRLGDDVVGVIGRAR
jgi:hypothetical protein